MPHPLHPGTRIDRVGQGFSIRLQRTIGHPPEAVWRMLTEAAELPRWLAPGDIEPVPGARARIDFVDSGTTIDSTVRVAEPPLRLEYAWSSPGEPERPLSWRLRPVEGGTLLTLTLQLPAGEDPAKACAGWDAHLEMLLAALEGVPIRFPVDHFLAVREACRALEPE
jgi:uncharacterized protein YndB with AHSA1/START domain